MFRVGVLLLVALATHQGLAQDYEFCDTLTLSDESSGNIISPKFPDPYENSVDCTMNFDTSHAKKNNNSRRLELYVNDFNLERNYDFFWVFYDGSNFLTYTGDGESSTDVNSNMSLGVGKTYVFDGTTDFYLRFSSDATIPSLGFNLTYTFTVGDAVEPPPPPPSEGSCRNATGAYIDETGAQLILSQKDDQQVEGLLKRGGEPVWLGLIGHTNRADQMSNAIALNYFGASSVLSLNGLCKECEGQRYLVLYETLVWEPSISCYGEPIQSENSIFRNFTLLVVNPGDEKPKASQMKLPAKKGTGKKGHRRNRKRMLSHHAA